MLLVDENLPLSLARQLGGQALHATELGDRLTDQQLWSRGRVVGG